MSEWHTVNTKSSLSFISEDEPGVSWSMLAHAFPAVQAAEVAEMGRVE